MVEIHSPAESGSGAQRTMAARVAGPGFDETIWMRGAQLRMSGDAFVAAVLPLAMAMGEPVEVIGLSVSPRLLRQLDTWQRIVCTWYPQLRPAEIFAAMRAPAAGGAAAPRGVASFFSGGVDSFASVLAHREELSALLLVHGFDVALDDRALWDTTVSRLRAAAEAIGLPLHTVETNVRVVLDRAGDWGLLTHGAALASVALLSQAAYHTILVPSSYSYNDLFPWGSHPLLDPLWSTEALTVIHDGAHCTRTDKVRAIAASPVALAHLRVCWQNHQPYNCGVCEKCVRTMVNLELCGALARCGTFDRTLDMALVRAQWIDDVHVAGFARDNLAAARQQPAYAAIANALEDSLWSFDCRTHAAALRTRLRQPAASRVLRRKVARLWRAG